MRSAVQVHLKVTYNDTPTIVDTPTCTRVRPGRNHRRYANEL